MDALLENDIHVINGDDAPHRLEVSLSLQSTSGSASSVGRWELGVYSLTKDAVVARATFNERLEPEALADQIRLLSARAVDASAPLLFDFLRRGARRRLP